MRKLRIVAPVAVALLLAGCGGAGKDSARCVEAAAAPDRLSSQLQRGLTFTGRAAAVKSKEFQNVYMVAAEFTGPGIGKEVGVWAMDNPSGPGTIFAVDAMARSFSGWPAADTARVQAGITTDGASEAKACVTG